MQAQKPTDIQYLASVISLPVLNTPQVAWTDGKHVFLSDLWMTKETFELLTRNWTATNLRKAIGGSILCKLENFGEVFDDADGSVASYRHSSNGIQQQRVLGCSHEIEDEVLGRLSRSLSLADNQVKNESLQFYGEFEFESASFELLTTPFLSESKRELLLQAEIHVYQNGATSDIIHGIIEINLQKNLCDVEDQLDEILNVDGNYSGSVDSFSISALLDLPQVKTAYQRALTLTQSLKPDDPAWKYLKDPSSLRLAEKLAAIQGLSSQTLTNAISAENVQKSGRML